MGKPSRNGNGRAPRPLTTYETLVRTLSDLLVEAQRPVRILDAVKWDDGVEKAFLASGCQRLPPVTRDYYQSRPLPYDPAAKLREFEDLERDVVRRLGDEGPGQILRRMCREYADVMRLLAARGTPEFAEVSRRLYGSSSDSVHGDEPSLIEFARTMSGMLDVLAHEPAVAAEEGTLDARQAVDLLQARLGSYFGDPAPRVKLSDGIVADAAAGCDYIKVRGDARFTPRQVRLLEVHEGWVHLGTTLNGQSQPVCTFLGKGPPSATLTQEGLAVITEVLAFASHPGRLRRLTDRIQGVAMAEDGADFLEVYRYFLEVGYPPRESYQNGMRVFRGSLPAGCGPFTKDLCYSKGFVLVYNFIRMAVRRGQVGRVPLLFCGKTTLADLKTLAHLADEGLVAPPRFVPPPFADLHALSAWMCYANFLDRLSLQRLEQEYAALF